MKVCIVCYGLNENNIRLQPWRYICEIARGLILKGVDVKILTDGAEQEQLIEGIPVLYIEKLRSFPLIKNNKLISLITKEKADIVLWSMGPIDYFYLSTFREINTPIIGMFTGPIYKIKDITRLGMYEIVSNFSSLSLQMIYASLPSSCSRNLVNSQTLSKVFVMSRKNRDMLVSMGADASKIVHIPAGIDKYDLIQPESPEYVISKFNVSPGSFNILYFGSPIN
jgi:glycosyltransferase involved in cell wall biosynthesis